jgi:predicted RNA-binding Zn ribbon-like protein
MPDNSGQPGRSPAAGSAPARLEIVRTFVNTLDIEAGTDALSTPADLVEWLRNHNLLGQPVARANADDLKQAVALREALRRVLISHVNGQHEQHGRSEHDADRPGAALHVIAADLPTRLDVTDNGQVRAAPAGSGISAALAEIVLTTAEATTLGTWTRLKACAADDCHWAFYDRSPTASGCWCSMAVCGSRAKSRAYRRRTAAERRKAAATR